MQFESRDLKFRVFIVLGSEVGRNVCDSNIIDLFIFGIDQIGYVVLFSANEMYRLRVQWDNDNIMGLRTDSHPPHPPGIVSVSIVELRKFGDKRALDLEIEGERGEMM